MKDESDVDGEAPLRKSSLPDKRESRKVAGPELPARRKFLQAGLLAGASAAVLSPPPALGASPNISPAFQTKGSAGSFELEEITVGELQEGMTSGRFTARSIAEKYLARIEAIDKHGPSIN